MNKFDLLDIIVSPNITEKSTALSEFNKIVFRVNKHTKKKIIKNAKKLGVKKIVINNLKNIFVKDYVFPMIRGHAIYEGVYLLGTSIARPLLATDQIQVPKKNKAFAVSHESTGKGNDQV